MAGHRPLYETRAHTSHETAFSMLVGQKFNCTFEKMPIRYGIDFCAMRDGVSVGFLEAKVRGNAADKYPTYMLSVGKFMYADSLMRVTGLPTTLAVRWTDAWGYTTLNQRPDSDVTIGGRRDRKDEQDMEPVFLIPMSSFTIKALLPEEVRWLEATASACALSADQALPASGYLPAPDFP